MIGIEKIKAAVDLAIRFYKQTAKVLEDGTVKPLELLEFVDEVSEIGTVVESGEQLLAELNDMDLNERNELMEMARTELNMSDEKIENIIVASLDLALAGYKFYTVAKPEAGA